MILLNSLTAERRTDPIEFGKAAIGRGFRLETAVFLPHSRDRVFAFFADAMQLEALSRHGCSLR
jgi:hypothetical protein